ncbi:MAG TPA: AAA family ATPase [Chthoniobacterales bacterium]|jgi:DNA polymerase-3 subunit delta'
MAFPPQHALERLLEAQSSGRLAHAYLLCGPRGSGKRAVIEQIAARILETDDALRHPDFHQAEPESKSRRILIEQIRHLEQALRTKPSAGLRKVAIIHEADRLQPQAANAFLKTLEEPPAGSHLFLTSSSPDALLETILSRCIVVQIQAGAPQPPTEAGEELLAALERLVERPASPTRAAFSLARTFLDVLGRERERIREESAAALKAEQTHYKQATDGAWLEEREEQLKALAEAAAIRTRAELMQTLAGWFADLLRVQHGGAAAFDRPILRAQAASTDPKSTLRRLQALDDTISALDRNVQEALAIEAGFLNLFTIPA